MNFNINFTKFHNCSPIFRAKNSTDNPINKENHLERTPENDTFNLKVGYVNDIHGQTNNMIRILSGLKGDLKLSAGDNDIGDEKNKKIHNATVNFLNTADIKASALGNHEIDMNQKECIETMKNFNGKVLAVNFEQVDLSEQEKEAIEKFGRADLKGNLTKSMIVKVNGEDIGIVGASPTDMLDRLTHPNYYKDCYIDNLEDTIELIRKEVNQLRENGINKIFLVSHLGYKKDKEVAKNIDGIDVIIGGHTHELIKDIKEGENLLYSPNGEPVIITTAGKDGNYFGELNLEFNKKGVIKKAQNNLGETRLFAKNMINQYNFEKILGKPEIVGFVEGAVEPPKLLTEENAHANFVCDILKEATNSDIGLWHNCGVRNSFHLGTLDTSDIKDMSPFLDYVVIADVSEKKIVDLFKKAIHDTYKSSAYKPGLLAVSGLNYTVNPNKKELVSMNFIDKNGNEIPIDIKNPSNDKKFRVVTDEFLMSAGADFSILADATEYIKMFPYDKDVIVSNYLKEHKEPIIINQLGRIKFEEN